MRILTSLAAVICPKKGMFAHKAKGRTCRSYKKEELNILDDLLCLALVRRINVFESKKIVVQE